MSACSLLDEAGHDRVGEVTLEAVPALDYSAPALEFQFHERTQATEKMVADGLPEALVGAAFRSSVVMLGRWVQAVNGGQAQSEPKTLAVESDEQRELRRLRQEVDYLREQRDILKKALGILSAEMPRRARR